MLGELDIAEANNGNILGDPKAVFLGPAQRPNGQGIVGRKDGGGAARLAHELVLTPALIEDIRAKVEKQVAAAANRPEQSTKEVRAWLREAQREIDNLVLAFKAGARSPTMIEGNGRGKQG